MSVASPHPSSARRLGRRTHPFSAVVVLIASAAIVGLLLGGILGDGDGDTRSPAPAKPPPATVHDGLRLQVPGGWTRGEGTAVPGFSRPLALVSADDRLSASLERLPATSPTLLPASFLQVVAGAPGKPSVIRLATGGQAWRYSFAQDKGAVMLLYAAPTTSGVATVACSSPTRALVVRRCDALAKAVTLPGSLPLVPGTSAAFYSRLPSVVTDLKLARTRGTEELRAAKSAARQTLAADGLARTHTLVGGALAPLTSKGDGLPTAAVAALNATATAYAALARTARARLPRPYAAAGRAVTAADRNLRVTMTKAAAAAVAATRTATKASVPAAAKPPAKTRPAPSSPVASTSSRSTDLTFVVLVLITLLVGGLALRAARRGST